MQFKNWKRLIYVGVILGGLCLVFILFTACRSMTKTIRIEAEIAPEPIVGEIVTLHIETLSPQESGDGVFVLSYNEGINFLEVAPDWYEPAGDQDVPSLEWRGQVAAGEPIVHKFKLCITEPGFSFINILGGVVGKGHGENKLYITSTGDSAEVIPSSKYKGVRQAPQGSTPTPTPEPVIVSPECTGENL